MQLLCKGKTLLTYKTRIIKLYRRFAIICIIIYNYMIYCNIFGLLDAFSFLSFIFIIFILMFVIFVMLWNILILVVVTDSTSMSPAILSTFCCQWISHELVLMPTHKKDRVKKGNSWISLYITDKCFLVTGTNGWLTQFPNYKVWYS